MIAKLHLFLILIFSIHACCFSSEPDYNTFSSFEELIVYETNQIANLDLSNYEDLADAYLNRAESYLISSKYELALEDIEKAYELSGYCRQEVRSLILLRSLLDLAFSYALLDKLDEFHRIESELKELFDAFECSRVEKRQASNRSKFHSGHAARSTNSEKPILGPDRISIDDCVDRAEKIAGAARILILKARVDVQAFLNILIQDLETRAIRCCLGGGIWKACLQPIANKWQQWNEKWRVFGIPPDPAWD
jgi:tetratricopeptide (TPR) repeat protein